MKKTIFYLSLFLSSSLLAQVTQELKSERVKSQTFTTDQKLESTTFEIRTFEKGNPQNQCYERKDNDFVRKNTSFDRTCTYFDVKTGKTHRNSFSSKQWNSARFEKKNHASETLKTPTKVEYFEVETTASTENNTTLWKSVNQNAYDSTLYFSYFFNEKSKKNDTTILNSYFSKKNADGCPVFIRRQLLQNQFLDSIAYSDSKCHKKYSKTYLVDAEKKKLQLANEHFVTYSPDFLEEKQSAIIYIPWCSVTYDSCYYLMNKDSQYVKTYVREPQFSTTQLYDYSSKKQLTNHTMIYHYPSKNVQDSTHWDFDEQDNLLRKVAYVNGQLEDSTFYAYTYNDSKKLLLAIKNAKDSTTYTYNCTGNIAEVKSLGTNTKTIKNYDYYEAADCESLENQDFDVPLVVYPNPAENVLQVRYLSATDVSSIHIYDAIGRSFFNDTYDSIAKSAQIQIDISNLPHGVYFLKAVQNGKITSKRFVKM